tara:strand:+ start:737 stop:1795 length:1059 start_codon:yes stop_codon:yes gene_type:complete
MSLSTKTHSIKDLTVNDGSSPIQIDTGDFTFPTAPVDSFTYYRLTGTSTLAGSNMQVTSTGTLHDKIRIRILYDATVTLSGHQITIFGEAIPDALATQEFMAECVYNLTTTSWTVIIIPDISATSFIETGNIKDLAVTTAKIADDAVTLAKMAGLAKGKIIYGDASGNPADIELGSDGRMLLGDAVAGVAAVDMSGDATISKAGALTIASNAITTLKILNANVTLAKLEDKLLYDMFNIRLDTKSAAATGNVNFTMPYDCDITHVVITVLEAVITDDTTFVLKDNGGASMGSIDVTTGMGIGNKATLGSAALPLSSNNSFTGYPAVRNLLIEVTKTTTTSGAYSIAFFLKRT